MYLEFDLIDNVVVVAANAVGAKGIAAVIVAVAVNVPVTVAIVAVTVHVVDYAHISVDSCS